MEPSDTTTSTETSSPIESALVGDLSGGWSLFPGAGNGGYDVLVYDRTLELSPDLTELSGFASISAVATQELQRFYLDARDLDIAAVTVDGEAADFVVGERELMITLGEPLQRGQEFVVEVDYTAAPEPFSPEGLPFEMGWDVDGGSQVVTHGFPGAEATWTPTNENPTERARYIHRVKAEEGFTVTASGSPIEDDAYEVWDTLIEVSGASLAVGNYELSVLEWNGIPVEFAAAPGASFVAEQLKQDTSEILDWLTTVFGPFPFERLGITLISNRPFSFSSPMRILQSPESTTGFVHELSHQWIGNSVTSADPETYNWVYEGLATYVETLYLEHQGGDLDDLARAMDSRVPDQTRALNRADSVDDLLDSATYNRGALFYHALRLEIGDEAFFESIRTFTQRHLHDIGEIHDLQTIAEQESDMDLDSFFFAWTEQAQVPPLLDN